MHWILVTVLILVDSHFCPSAIYSSTDIGTYSLYLSLSFLFFPALHNHSSDCCCSSQGGSSSDLVILGDLQLLLEADVEAVKVG